MKIKQHSSEQPRGQKRNQKRNQNIFDMNENRMIIYQNIRNIAKVVQGGMFLVINAYIKKKICK